MANTTANNNDYELIQTEPIVKDWDWWSNFLQREYYGTPEEYDAWAETGDAVAAELGISNGDRILDLGSGCGELAMQLALHGAEVVGIEQSPTLVQHCNAAATRRNANARFVAADMFTYQPDGTYNAVICVNTSFGYGTDQQNRELIAKIGGWLAPGGALYLDLISADRAEAFGSWNDAVAGGRLLVDNSYDAERQLMTSYPTWVAPNGHELYTSTTPEQVQLYTRAAVETMMRDAGLAPMRLVRAMGRKFEQDDEQMLTTWIARKTA